MKNLKQTISLALIFIMLLAILISCVDNISKPSSNEVSLIQIIKEEPKDESEQIAANEAFKKEIDRRINEDKNANLNNLSLKYITSLEGLFKDKDFTGDIANWNVSKIKNFKSMFEGSTFNSDISKWDTSLAENMQFMFKNNKTFDQDLSSWKINDKTFFASIFKDASKMLETIEGVKHSKMPSIIKGRYDRMLKPSDNTLEALKVLIDAQIARNGNEADYNYIDTSDTISFQGLFSGNNINKSNFNGKINDWDTSKVINFKSMFENSNFNSDISKWDTSTAQHMQFMFKDNIVFDQDLSSWIIDKDKTIFASIFKGATQMLGGFDIGRNSYEGSDKMPAIIRDRYNKMKKVKNDSASELRKLILDEIQANGESGNIADYNYIDTSENTSFINLFSNISSFNGKINDWDTSKVTNMSSMFSNAKSFNTPIDDWDTSKVKSLFSMFHNATAFNQPLNNWNTLKVTMINAMFQGATSFNQPLDKWDISNVTTSFAMFNKATSFNQNIENWNTLNITNMASMFERAASFNQPLEKWNVSKVTNTSSMFNEATSFNKPLEKWNVSALTNMSLMFNHAIAFNQPIGKWDISNVNNIQKMFFDAISFNKDLNAWDDKLKNGALLTKLQEPKYKAMIFYNSSMREENKPTKLR